jgi:hypothetical protein
MIGHVARMEGRRGSYEVLVGRPNRKRLLGRPKHRWANKVFFGTEFISLSVGGL